MCKSLLPRCRDEGVGTRVPVGASLNDSELWILTESIDRLYERVEDRLNKVIERIERRLAGEGKV